jgi:DNA-binding transcriptional MerR regulator
VTAAATGRDGLRIGELAARAGTTPPTIRYYEAIDLLPRAGRQRGGQRRYTEADVERLTFIRRCRDFGFGIDQVKALLGLVADPTRDCIEARDLAHANLRTVRARIAELRALERAIATFAEQCDALCAGGPGGNCVPLTRLTARDAPPGARRGRRAIGRQ